MELTPREPGKIEIDFAVKQDALTYDIKGLDEVGIDLTLGLSTWPAGAILTAELCFGGTGRFDDPPDGAVSYTSLGNKTPIAVTKATKLRLRMSTAIGSAGAATVVPVVSGFRERP
jgi:hypothetical protein